MRKNWKTAVCVVLLAVMMWNVYPAQASVSAIAVGSVAGGTVIVVCKSAFAYIAEKIYKHRIVIGLTIIPELFKHVSENNKD